MLTPPCVGPKAPLLRPASGTGLRRAPARVLTRVKRGPTPEKGGLRRKGAHCLIALWKTILGIQLARPILGPEKKNPCCSAGAAPGGIPCQLAMIRFGEVV